jgi:hypothetical protein
MKPAVAIRFWSSVKVGFGLSLLMDAALCSNRGVGYHSRSAFQSSFFPADKLITLPPR